MALDKITTDIIADDAVTAAKIVAGAVEADIRDDSITLAKMAGGTDGQIITYDASGDPVAVGPGTDGQVLTSTGAGSPPAFEALPSQAAFASGTKMIFNQTAAPTGWTKVTGSGNDTALRVTTGTVGTGGSVAFETAFASHTPTASGGAVASHTLTTSEMPAHTHTGGSTSTFAAYQGPHYTGATSGSGGSTGGGGGHTHTFTQPTISAVNLDVSYIDVIIATKD